MEQSYYFYAFNILYLIGDRSFRLYHPILANIGLSPNDANGNGIVLRKKVQLAIFRIFKVMFLPISSMNEDSLYFQNQILLKYFKY